MCPVFFSLRSSQSLEMFAVSYILTYLYTGMWTLDPIDGTKGFLRGGQYAVCLALLIDARVELGVIGCPNIPSIPSPSSYQNTSTSTDKYTPNSSGSTATPDDASANPGDTGALFVAVRGHGAYQLPLLVPSTPPPPTPPSGTSGSQSDITPNHRRFRLNMPRLALHELSFLESVEKAHAALDTNARVAARLGVRAGPVRMDSQAKYAALVRGDGGGGVYLRLPVAGGGRGGEPGGYQEKIWVSFTDMFHFAKRKKKNLNLIFVLFYACVCRTTPPDRSSSKKLAELSPIIVGVRWTLVLGARSVRIMVWLLRGRRSTLR